MRDKVLGHTGEPDKKFNTACDLLPQCLHTKDAAIRLPLKFEFYLNKPMHILLDINISGAYLINALVRWLGG